MPSYICACLGGLDKGRKPFATHFPLFYILADFPKSIQGIGPLIEAHATLYFTIVYIYLPIASKKRILYQGSITPNKIMHNYQVRLVKHIHMFSNTTRNRKLPPPQNHLSHSL